MGRACQRQAQIGLEGPKSVAEAEKVRDGRDMQTKAEIGRRREREAEPGRGNQRKAEMGMLSHRMQLPKPYT